MKRVFLYALVFFCATALFAQTEVGEVDPTRIGVTAPNQNQSIKEVSVEKFEKEGYWFSYISPDNGYTASRLFTGNPSGKEPLEDEAAFEIPDTHVFGTRIDFLHRGHASVYFRPQRPIPVEGITKTVSVWAVGRNYRHELYLLVKDFFGREFELRFNERLDFPGWKKLTVAIPPQADDGRNGIVQSNYHYFNKMGLMITGLMIKVDPAEAYGSYYVYFDDLRAVTDIFTENSRDADDMPDAW